MVADAVARHMGTVRKLSKPGQALAPNAPTATINNSRWWIDGEATPARRRLHVSFLTEVRDGAPDVEQSRRAIVLAGPPGAGKSTILKEVLGKQIGTYRVIDADEFKKLLLREAQKDGSYEGWLVPVAVSNLQTKGEQFFPLELASLVHEESSILAKKLRDDAIVAGDNIVIDAVLSDAVKAIAMGQHLADAGYDVEVIDVEVPYELSEQRIRERWAHSYTSALNGGDPLGGRWVPSEYARDIFEGPDGRSKPAWAAEEFAERCPVVSRYRVFRTTMEEAQAAVEEKRQARASVVTDRSRASAKDPLVDTAL